MQHTLQFLERAEATAASTLDATAAMNELRKLSLDDYGLFIISLPNEKYPALSSILPRMASAEVQKQWTGADGVELLKQTVAFTRIVETCCVRYMGRPLQDSTILDFGCGYGRILRMMYYYTNPDHIWGIDAWDSSLALCRQSGILGNLVQSARAPNSLPVESDMFDFAFAFSVFTHLAPKAAVACLSAIRKAMRDGGLLVLTIRPIEFWTFIDEVRGTNLSKDLISEHNRTGVAYLPHSGEEGETYGDVSLTFEFFKRDGWELVGYDRSLHDMFQLSVILRAI